MKPRLPYWQAAPEAMKAMGAAGTYVDASSIEERLRLLVELRVSQLNGCVYCVDLHTRELRDAGEEQRRLDCLPVWREAPYFNERERAALTWAESLTLVSVTGAPDDDYAYAHRHFTDRELVDLTMVIAVMNAWNRFGVGFRHMPGGA